MTYYVKKNTYPEKRAELRLAVNAGSLLETDEQQGLAHFVEHMCFNGTKNFPKNTLIDFLELSGTKFGAHLNAFTSFEKTVYMLRTRTDTADLFQKSMLVMEDWAHNVTFDDAEIDKERGVVIEEWRLRQGAQTRMQEKYFPVLYHNSRYAERLPIGKVEILEKFKYETIRQFYKDWYRPDLMAIIAVGDFDVDAVEKLIRERFGAIPMPPNPKPRPEFPLPTHDQTLVSIVTDKEATGCAVQMMNKFYRKRTGTYQDYLFAVKESIVSQMMQTRMEELTRTKDSPFAVVYANGYEPAVGTMAFSYYSQCGEKQIKAALRTLLTENARAIRFGFTQGEFDRTIASLKADYEKRYNERDKMESDDLAMDFVRHYLDVYDAMGITEEYRIATEILKNLTLGDINTFAQELMQEKSRVIVITAPEKDGVDLPTQDEVLAMVNQTGSAPLEGYKDQDASAPLLTKEPKPGKTTQTKEYKDVGFTEWVLSNGAKVWIKPTTFKNDEISFHALSLGGTSLYSDADYLSARSCTDVAEWLGYGSFTPVQLQKKLAGKNINLSAYINIESEGLYGSSTPADFETFLQLLHLTVTEPRLSQEDFEVFKKNMKLEYQNRSVSPEAAFFDTLRAVINGYHPRSRPMTEARVDEINMERAIQIYKQRFANAADFTYIFVGNIDPVKHKPLIEKYIGSLPVTGPKEDWKDLGIRIPKGTVSRTVKKGKEPKSIVMVIFPSDLNWTPQERTALRMACELLGIKLRENMREEQGGVYNVGANPSMTRYPKDQVSVMVRFGCAPKNVEKLIATIFDEVTKLKMNGPEENDLAKVRETELRSFDTDAKENRFWMSTATGAITSKSEPMGLQERIEVVKNIKAKDIQEAIKKHFIDGQHLKIVLVPED